MTGTVELLATDLLAALEHAPDGMMVTDVELDAPDGPRILYVNEALCRMTGYVRAGAAAAARRACCRARRRAGSRCGGSGARSWRGARSAARR